MPDFEPFDCPGCGARIESAKVAKFHAPGEHDEHGSHEATPPLPAPIEETKPGEPVPPPDEPAKPRGFDFSTPLADL